MEILERAQRHLEKLASNYRREFKQASGGELRTLLEKDEKLRAEREKALQNKATREQEIIAARRQINDIDQLLRDSQNAKSLQQQRDRLDKDVKQRRGELQETINIIREKATTGYVVFAQPAIQKALAILNQKRERGEIPSSIRQQFIQDLLEQMVCICAPFSEHGLTPTV